MAKTVLLYMDKRIIFVCGRICSGKNTFCKSLALHKHIVVSDVVKRLTGEISRAKLQDTAELDSQIVQELMNLIDSSDQVVIDGIRQLSILDALLAHYDKSDCEIVWLRVPPAIRKERYLLRNDSKDAADDFERAEERDVKLGIADLHSACFERLQARIIAHY